MSPRKKSHAWVKAAQEGTSHIHPVMNNTKWDKVRLAMYGLEPAPAWSTLSLEGYQSRPEREWFYHFRIGGYDTIAYVDITADDAEHREQIRAALQKVHVPGEETAAGFRVFGYLQNGQAADFL